MLEEGMGWSKERVARREGQCSNSYSWSWEDFKECNESCWRDGEGTCKCITCHCSCWGKSCCCWGVFFPLSFLISISFNRFSGTSFLYLVVLTFLLFQAKLSDLEKKICASDNQVYILVLSSSFHYVSSCFYFFIFLQWEVFVLPKWVTNMTFDPKGFFEVRFNTPLCKWFSQEETNLFY